MNAASIVVKIPHVVWREGRPRFVPGPALRKLGFKGRDLRHPDGRWYDLKDCQDFVTALAPEITARRLAASKPGTRLKPARQSRRQDFYCVADLFADLFREPRFQPQAAVRVRALSPASVRSYKGFARTLQDFDEDLWAAPVAAISAPVAHGLYERLYAAKSLHVARATIATTRMAWSWARRKGKVKDNPFKDLGMETPDGRRRAASPAEIRQLVATADAQGRPEIGDMIWLGLVTSQRQGDRLSMRWSQIEAGRWSTRQGKTGKRVGGTLGPMLSARLEAARARRKDHKVQWPHVIIDETAKAPFKADHYRHVWAAIRTKAAETMPSLSDLRDQDLRDTALTWARRGGADFDTRRKLSGHSAQAAALEERSYLAAEETDGAEAVAAIMAVWDKAAPKPGS